MKAVAMMALVTYARHIVCVHVTCMLHVHVHVCMCMLHVHVHVACVCDFAGETKIVDEEGYELRNPTPDPNQPRL